MKAGCILVIAVLATGCSRGNVRAEPFNGPDGQPGYVLTCRKLAACYRYAGVYCPRGYSLIDRQSSSRAAYTTFTGNSAFTVVGHRTSVVVSCH